MRTFIVTRHPGAVAWLKEKGFTGEVMPHLSPEIVNSGDRVIGVLPITLAAELVKKGVKVFVISLPKVAFGDRGQELTPAEMGKAGARLFKVDKIKLQEI